MNLLFTDVGLPGGLSGPQLGKAARALHPKLKILYTSGFAREKLRQEGLTDEDALISKPFTYDALLHKLAAILTNTVQPGAILLIEDEYIIRMALAESLRDFGFEVVEAGTIAEALVQLSSNHHRITALLVDVGLPDGRGDDLVVRLRAEGTVLPVVFTTGRGDAKFRDRFQDDPRTRFLIKPFLAEAVVDTLRQLKFVA